MGPLSPISKQATHSGKVLSGTITLTRYLVNVRTHHNRREERTTTTPSPRSSSPFLSPLSFAHSAFPILYFFCISSFFFWSSLLFLIYLSHCLRFCQYSFEESIEHRRLASVTAYTDGVLYELRSKDVIRVLEMCGRGKQSSSIFFLQILFLTFSLILLFLSSSEAK